MIDWLYAFGRQVALFRGTALPGLSIQYTGLISSIHPEGGSFRADLVFPFQDNVWVWCLGENVPRLRSPARASNAGDYWFFVRRFRWKKVFSTQYSVGSRAQQTEPFIFP
ncbi:MAG: hypothetical protein D6714_21740 [Bacteroidetes bacterium]|nr:MAG: hypothetical protein D6714_21740 [Bacteroidota bacterium]